VGNKLLEQIRQREEEYRRAVKRDFPLGSLVTYQFDKESLGIVIGYTIDDERMSLLDHPIHVIVYWHKGVMSVVKSYLNAKCPVHPKVLRQIADDGTIVDDIEHIRKRERILDSDTTIYGDISRKRKSER
jgi:hypothetical protein